MRHCNATFLTAPALGLAALALLAGGAGYAGPMGTTTRVGATLCVGATPCVGAHSPVQDSAADLKPKDVVDAGVIEQVVLYRGQAAVTRTVRRELPQGVWALRVEGLPATVSAQSLQAKVTSGAANGAATDGSPKLLGVEYVETALAEFGGTPEGMALVRKLDDLKKRLAYLAQDAAQLDLQLKLVEQIGVRAAANATNDGGTQALNLESVAEQLSFVATQRAALGVQRREMERAAEELARQVAAAQAELNARGGSDLVQRTAVAVVAQPTAGPVEVQVTYVVGNATWEPIYNIRGAGDRSGVEIEYDAMITQATGEDWKDVRLSLSTAQPSRAAAPPAIQPWFVDVVVARPGRSGSEGVRFGTTTASVDPEEMTKNLNFDDSPSDREHFKRSAAIERLGQAAGVQETGTAVSFDLPRALTIPTDNDKRQRTRIAGFKPVASFVYTAQPIVTEDVFLRGDLENASSYQLLPGRAQIFMGGDFIGETSMPSVAPKDEFKVYFGPDRAFKARRELVAKNTGSSGFFGSSVLTTWDYRVTIDNSSGRSASMELFDRYPVSRHDKIESKLEKPSHPLSTDKEYVEGTMTQGILRWDLTVPATARNANALAVTWTVGVSRPKDMQTTPLPAD